MTNVELIADTKKFAAGLAAAERHLRIHAVGYDYAAESKHQVRKCPLCSCAEATVIAGMDRYGHTVEAKLCTACALVYLSPRMGPAGYAEFYEKWYRPLVHAYAGVTNDNGYASAQARETARSYADWVDPFCKHPSRQTLLDIGGSEGFFAGELMRRHGYQATVLDPCPAEALLAEQSGCRAVVGLLEDFQTDERFDVVSMVQTVDHLLDLRGAFEKVQRLLTPHGVFIVDFVDWSYFALRVDPVTATKIDHPLNFTAETSLAALLRFGFEPLQMGRSDCGRHLLAICRPVPPIDDAMPSARFVEAMHRKFVECQELVEVPV